MKTVALLARILTILSIGAVLVQAPVALGMAPPATSICVIMPEICLDTLDAIVTANPNPVVADYATALTAQVSGTATGTINYTFYCNNDPSNQNVDDSTLIKPGYSHKKDNVSTNPYTFGPGGIGTGCMYSQPGDYIAKVIIERGTALPIEKRITVTVLRPVIDVTFTALPASGTTPNFRPQLRAEVGGNAVGTINYTFYCDQNTPSTAIVNGYAKKDTSPTSPYISTDCLYEDAGTYYAKVIVERSSAISVEKRVELTVSTPPVISTPTTPVLSPTPLPTGTGTGFPYGGGSGSF